MTRRKENEMKSPNNNLLGSDYSTQASPVSKLSRIAFRLALSAAFLGGLAVSGLSNYANAQAKNTSAAVLEHPKWAQLPGALIRPDCVHEIPKGAKVEVAKDGSLTGDVTLKGELVAHYDSCSEPAVMSRQNAATHSAMQSEATTGSGWVEDDQYNAPLSASDNIDFVGGNFTVPSYPSERDGGQIIYLSNGIDPASHKWFMEAALQYGYNGAFGGNYYSISTWLISANAVYYSTPEVVLPGDSLTAYTEMIGKSGSTTDWDVVIQDNRSGAYSEGAYWVSGQHWTWAYAGILQAYYISSCAEFPASGREVFKNSVIAHGFPSYEQISYPNWKGAGGDYDGPTCHLAVVAASATLDF
jgi:hypothetical protein